MKKFFGRAWKYTKAVALPLGGVALSLAGQGYFGPKGAAAAAAITTLIGVFVRRPQDQHPSDPTPAPEAK